MIHSEGSAMAEADKDEPTPGGLAEFLFFLTLFGIVIYGAAVLIFVL